MHFENELYKLKTSLFEMWVLVEKQLQKAELAWTNYDKDLAHEVISRERKVNALELKIDAECEVFIATHTPVAVDLRMLLSILKINNNLERIGDFAESIARFVIKHQTQPVAQELASALQLEVMKNTISEMMHLAKKGWKEENCSCVGKVFSMDDIVDEINKKSVEIIASHITKYPETVSEMMHLNTLIRRYERIGDRLNNIAEDICFFVDAKELRHQDKQ